MARRAIKTTRESRRIAAAYYRAIIAGRPLRVAARRCGVSVCTLRRHGQMWPEHRARLVRSTTLRPWERANLERMVARYE